MNTILEPVTSFISHANYNAVSGNPVLSYTPFKPFGLKSELLTDTSLLPEIFDLRLRVWEHSGKSEFVNRKLYPDGWYDELDLSAFHWVVFNNEDKIIASARLNLFYSMEDFPYYLSMEKFSLPAIVPFAFFSRLVVEPAYRQNGLSRKLYDSRAVFCEEMGARWSQVFINNPIIISQFEKSGFKNIGQTEVAYHPSATAHSVNVLIQENNFS